MVAGVFVLVSCSIRIFPESVETHFTSLAQNSIGLFPSSSPLHLLLRACISYHAHQHGRWRVCTSIFLHSPLPIFGRDSLHFTSPKFYWPISLLRTLASSSPRMYFLSRSSAWSLACLYLYPVQFASFQNRSRLTSLH